MTDKSAHALPLCKEKLLNMQISEAQAKRWGITVFHARRVRAFYVAIAAHLKNDPIPTETDVELDLDPLEIVMAQAYVDWEKLEQYAARMKKEIAVRRMDSRTPLTAIAEQLRISRPTLYAWQKEISNSPESPELLDTWFNYDDMLPKI